MYFPESISRKKFFDLTFDIKKSQSFFSFFQFEKREGVRLIQAKGRLLVTSAFFILFFLSIIVRLVEIMGIEGEESSLLGNNPIKPITFSRADIIDRNGVLLATNLKTASLYAHPHQIVDVEEVVEKLVSALPMFTPEEVRSKLNSSKKFVWLARNLTPEEQAKVHNLGIPAFNFHYEEKRVYPQGHLLAHVLGFTNVDNQGIGGVEYFFNKNLVKNKDPLQLSIDIRIQHIITEELKKDIEVYNAKGGTALVLNIKTGEILAMASLPDFDPNAPQQATQDVLFNRATLGVYEMGSLFKIFTAAMALDKGVTSLKKGYDASHPMKVARFTITDNHPKNRWLSVPEIIIYSSNIGTAKMALEVGVAAQKEFMKKIGFLQPLTLELSEVGRPLIPKEWTEVSAVTISYGYGLGVSPLQLACTLGAMINKGIFQNPTLLRREAEVKGKQIIREETSDQIRKLMRLVVTHGTGRKAKVDGYLVGGKSGSAYIRNVGGRGYNKKENLATFVAGFPMQDPEYVILVLLDCPKGNKETFGFTSGGWTSANTVRRIISRISPILGVLPMDENNPSIQKAIAIPEFIGDKENTGALRHVRY